MARGGCLAADRPDEPRRLDTRRWPRPKSISRQIADGQIVTVKWRGKPVFVRHRTPKEIDDARGRAAERTARSGRPTRARASKPEWLVVIGICTHLGCIPLGHQGEYDGWFCPCHGSQYDTAGRIRKGPAPHNLDAAALRLPLRHQDPDRLTVMAATGCSRDDSMSGPSTYEPKNGFAQMARERGCRSCGLVHSSFVAYPTPRNLNYWWTFGGILSFMLVAQIVTGIVLAMHYTPNSTSPSTRSSTSCAT